MGTHAVICSKRINILKCDPLTETRMNIRLLGQANGEKNNYGRKKTGKRTKMIKSFEK